MNFAEQIPKQYDPQDAQRRWYDFWLEKGYFHADPSSAKPPYTIVIPPPNVTGALHLGHALNNTLQDILIRWRRMQGFDALWMPGTDHAGIATQAVVERQLKEKEDKTRHDVGREGLIERIWAWKEQYGNRILSQLQRLGASCDWDRARFTLDEMCARAVRETFFRVILPPLAARTICGGPRREGKLSSGLRSALMLPAQLHCRTRDDAAAGHAKAAPRWGCLAFVFGDGHGSPFPVA